MTSMKPWVLVAAISILKASEKNRSDECTGYMLTTKGHRAADHIARAKFCVDNRFPSRPGQYPTQGLGDSD